MEISPFIELFGDHPRVRVMDFLFANDMEFSKTELARYSNVSFNTLEVFWGLLVEKEIIAPTRKVGRVVLYSLNRENPVVSELLDLEKKLLLRKLWELEEKIAL